MFLYLWLLPVMIKFRTIAAFSIYLSFVFVASSKHSASLSLLSQSKTTTSAPVTESAVAAGMHMTDLSRLREMPGGYQ